MSPRVSPEQSGGWAVVEVDVRGRERLILAELFERATRAAGHGRLWRAYVSGRLGLAETDRQLERLAAGPVPRGREACDALAAGHGVDRAALWWVIVEGSHARAPRARPGGPTGGRTGRVRPIAGRRRASTRPASRPG
jgi:hypothetical protein